MAKFRVHLTIGGLKHIAGGEVKVEGVIETDEGEPFRLSLNEDLPMQLKLARVARGLTLRELGQLSGLSASGIGRIERGERSPGAHTVAELEKALREE